MPQRLCFGRCELRLDTRELRVAGVRQRVRRRVFDLVNFLVQQRPRVVPHGELMRAVWQRADVSQPVLARAVMEARRACGDDAEAPRLIVSVHGVGYRFAGDVVGGSSAHAPAPGMDKPSDAAVEEVRALVRSARLANFEHRFEQARSLAEEALSRARALGLRSEQVRALLSCSSQALHRRELAEAAGLAKQAVEIARIEGFAPLMAEAGMWLGGLHVVAGVREAGIRQLREAMQVFSQPGYEHKLRACLTWMGLAMRDQGELEMSLQLCRRAIAVQVPGTVTSMPPIVDHLNEMQLLIELGDRDAAAGLASAAHNWFQQALEASQALLPSLEAAELGVMRASCLNRQWVALERLDRLDEACAAAAACDEQRARLTDGRQWPDAEHRALFRVQRARLLARTGRPRQALADLVETLANAADSETRSESLVNLYRTAADVAILAGDHGQAAQWLRAQCDAVVKTQQDRAASTAAMLAAELNLESLQLDLDLARSELRDLLSDNARLRRRLQQLAGTAAAATGTA